MQLQGYACQTKAIKEKSHIDFFNEIFKKNMRRRRNIIKGQT